MEDSQIIDLYWKRDTTAIHVTNEKYGNRLQHLAQKMLPVREDAEECVNDTYLGAWNTIPPVYPEHFFAYLAKICRNLVFNKIDWLNAKKRKAEIVELTQELEACIPNPDDQRRYTSEEIGSVLTSFLNGLQEEPCRIFLRRYWFADSIYDISKRYQISQSKVKTTLFRTRNKLKAYLESEGIQL